MLADVVRVQVPEALEPRSIQRVLLAFDGSPGAWKALERAIDVAVGQHARLTIAGVVGEPTVWTGFGPGALPFTREMLRHDLEREMEQHLAMARDEVPATVSVDTRVLHGRAAVRARRARRVRRLRPRRRRPAARRPAPAPVRPQRHPCAADAQRRLGARRQGLNRSPSHAAGAAGAPSRSTVASISP